VPVVTIGQAEVPGFYARTSGVPSPWQVATAAAAARIVGEHLGLGLGSGILVCAPVPEGDALPDDVARKAIDQAVEEADRDGIAGPDLTPWLLARIAELTDGAAVRANTALIVNNARIAAEIAGQLAG
jgi:pseudouridine-5'-phosphate glycosidase